jgi:hypothetical protein
VRAREGRKEILDRHAVVLGVEFDDPGTDKAPSDALNGTERRFLVAYRAREDESRPPGFTIPHGVKHLVRMDIAIGRVGQYGHCVYSFLAREVVLACRLRSAAMGQATEVKVATGWSLFMGLLILEYYGV